VGTSKNRYLRSPPPGNRAIFALDFKIFLVHESPHRSPRIDVLPYLIRV